MKFKHIINILNLKKDFKLNFKLLIFKIKNFLSLNKIKLKNDYIQQTIKILE